MFRAQSAETVGVEARCYFDMAGTLRTLVPNTFFNWCHLPHGATCFFQPDAVHDEQPKFCGHPAIHEQDVLHNAVRGHMETRLGQ